jgi:hypothetical protein
VADILGVDVSNSRQQLLDYMPDLIHREVLVLEQVGVCLEVHHQETDLVLEVEVHTAILDNIWVFQSMDLFEVVGQE